MRCTEVYVPKLTNSVNLIDFKRKTYVKTNEHLFEIESFSGLNGKRSTEIEIQLDRCGRDSLKKYQATYTKTVQF